MEEDEALISYTEKQGSPISVCDTFITYRLLCQAAFNVPFVWRYMPSRKLSGWSLTEREKLLGRKKEQILRRKHKAAAYKANTKV